MNQNKSFIKFLWEGYTFLKVVFNYLFKTSKNIPKIFYGGAIKGNLGGPFVKIKKLNLFFPEHNWNFNIVYLLSNSIYLSPKSLILIKRKSIPIILNQNGVFYPAWFKGDWKKQNLKMSQIYHSADYVLWQSKFCKKASEKFLGKRIGKGEILYNSVDTSFFTPEKKSRNAKFTFLITGNFRKQSNYRILNVLYAFKEIIKENKNIYLKIAGYIEEKKFFLSKIFELNLENHIILIGSYKQKHAPEIYKSANAYITISYQDNCPSAVLEAMACGLPILYSASGGIPELVDKHSGIDLKVQENWETTLIPKTCDIQKGMRQIMEHKDDMSLASRARAVELFDIRKWINKHNLIFEKLLEN